MSERKYTDEEIIKAFELCLTPQGTTYTCKKCPLHELENLCKVERNRGLLALVKTQKADLEIIARQFDDLSKVSNKLHSENMSQRAEIEKLQEVNADLNESLRLAAEANKDLNAEIERLKAEQMMAEGYADALEERAKAEAIKEFAERLHKGIDDFRDKREMVMLPYTESALLIIERKIDNLVAEMTEGK